MKVTELNLKARYLLENYFADIELEGEITKLVKHSSGHWYFTLKDDNSSITCCMFKNDNFSVDFTPEDTNYVKMVGKLSVWEVAGRYQFIASSMKKVLDIGELEKKFLLLKQKLESEGLFDKKHKKPIPYLPKKIAIITSKTGAVITDMLNVLQNDEYYLSEIFLYDCLMQGENSPKMISKILKHIDNLGYDVIIIARGGGSKEDLFCFNDEELAYNVFNAKTPIISAIGHGIDVNIIDYVADLSVPTPTAAMQTLSVSKEELEYKVDNFMVYITNLMQLKLTNYQNNFLNLQKNFNISVLKEKLEKHRIVLNNIKQDLDYFCKLKIDNLNQSLVLKDELLKSTKTYLLNNENNVNITKNGKIIKLDKIKNEDIVELIGQKYKIKVKVLEIIKE